MTTYICVIIFSRELQYHLYNLAALFICTGELCRSKKIFFHTDAAQAIGKIPLDVDDMKIDLMSISGHKIYGPKGSMFFNFF